MITIHRIFNRVGNVDLNALTAKVAQDIALADAWQPARQVGSVSRLQRGLVTEVRSPCPVSD
jgi:hypothetical protein